MDTTDVTGHIGTEVRGLSLSAATDAEIEALRQLVAERGMLFFRDQALTLEEHVRLGTRFGTLHVHPAAAADPRYPEAMQVFTEPDSTSVAGESWHSDVTCDELPPALSILHMFDVPETGGDTLWASSYRAYETLSEPIQRMLERLEAEHSSAHYYKPPLRFRAGWRYAPRGGPPGRDDTSVDGAAGPLRQLDVHDVVARPAPERKRSASEDALRPRRPRRRFPGSTSLGAQYPRDLGQQVHPAPRSLGLLPRAQARPSYYDEERASGIRCLTPAASPSLLFAMPGVLSTVSAVGEDRQVAIPHFGQADFLW